MPKLQKIKIDGIDPNPYRCLGNYPFVERKIETLVRSIKDVGLWEGVIGRKRGNRIELAFGHHRVEAARQALGKDAEISLIVRDLDDKEMIQFMGRENMEDYNADFLTMLETWEAVENFKEFQNSQPLELASVLGWTTNKGDGKVRMSNTAAACSAAYNLIKGNYIKREDLTDMTVRSAREICTHAQANMKKADTWQKKFGGTDEEVKQAKKHIGRGAVKTAKDVREGKVDTRNLRGAVDANTFEGIVGSKKKMPLFDRYAEVVSDSINKLLATDALSEKLAEIEKVAGDVALAKDKRVLKSIDVALASLSLRATAWKIDLSKKGNAVDLKLIKGKKNA